VNTQITAVQDQEESSTGPGLRWPARYARFGNFLVDGEREELYRDGQRVRVQAKIYQALTVLMGRAGDLVSREEVRQGVWPEAPASTLDANVNTAMNKLRQLLGDSPEKPVYIETIPRRGYCFIAKVEFSDAPPALGGSVPTQNVDPAARNGGGIRFILQYIAGSPVRLASVVVASMVLGALMVLAWSFVNGKNQQGARHDAEVVSQRSAPKATSENDGAALHRA
jgi:DNA-binding winged helix-turn-helix (wHTH) protein